MDTNILRIFLQTTNMKQKHIYCSDTIYFTHKKLSLKQVLLCSYIVYALLLH